MNRERIFNLAERFVAGLTWVIAGCLWALVLMAVAVPVVSLAEGLLPWWGPPMLLALVAPLAAMVWKLTQMLADLREQLHGQTAGRSHSQPAD